MVARSSTGCTRIGARVYTSPTTWVALKYPGRERSSGWDANPFPECSHPGHRSAGAPRHSMPGWPTSRNMQGVPCPARGRIPGETPHSLTVEANLPVLSRRVRIAGWGGGMCRKRCQLTFEPPASPPTLHLSTIPPVRGAGRVAGTPDDLLRGSAWAVALANWRFCRRRVCVFFPRTVDGDLAGEALASSHASASRPVNRGRR